MQSLISRTIYKFRGYVSQNYTQISNASKKDLLVIRISQGFSQAASAALGAADIGHWPSLLPWEHLAHSAPFQSWIHWSTEPDS